MKPSSQQGNRPSLRSLVDALKHGLRENLWGVVLFGPVARGEAGEDSDLDLLLVADGLPEKSTTRMQFLRQMVPGGLRGAVAFIARTRAEFEGSFPSLSRYRGRNHLPVIGGSTGVGCMDSEQAEEKEEQ